MNEAADTTAGKANLLNKKLQDYSRTLGQSWKQTLSQFKELAGTPNEQFTGFQTPLGKDVTADVFQQTEALAKAAQAKNQYITEDSRAAASSLNFDGSVKKVNVSIGEQSAELQKLSAQLNNLKYPTQGRNNLGQFTSPTPPSFENQFASLSSYEEQLTLVQSTIAKLHETTNLPFKDIGAQLGKSFPELLKDTNLVSTAVANLTKQNQGLSASFKTEAETIALVKEQLTQLQAEGSLNLSGLSRQGQINQLKSVIGRVSQDTGAQYGQVAKALEGMGVPAAQAAAAVKGLNHELTVGTKEAKGFHGAIDIIRTALGTLTAIGVFSFFQGIQNAVGETIKSIKELDGALYNLKNAERILSQQGVEITPKDLQGTIESLQKLDPLLSRVDATKAASSVALFTKELGFNKKQIDDLTKDIAVLSVRNRALGLTFEQVQSQVLTGLLTGRAQGIRDLGVSISDDAIKAEALRLKLVETSKAYENLSGDSETKVKAAATLSIIGKSQEEERKNLEDYFNTVDGQIGKVQSQWKNLLTTLGADLAPALVEYFKGLVVQLQHLNEWLTKNQATIREFIAVVSGLIAGGAKLNEIKGEGFLSRLNVKKNFQEFVQAVKDGMDEAKGYVTDFGSALDTPTEAVNNFASAIDKIDTEKAQNALRDLLKSLEDLQNQMAQKEADFQLKLSRFDEDSARERGQIVEDYNLNVAQTIRQFNLRRQESERKYRQNELDQERRFQEQLRQLREKFLYDLEDALRERDARQVLRLIDQYNMQKQNLINENALRKKDAQEKQKLDEEQAKREQEERLREMAEDEAVRLQRFDEEQAVKRARMEQDHQIEMAQLKAQEDEKIRQAAEKIAEEYGINEKGADALYNLLKQYYGTDGALANLTAQGYNGMLQQASGFLSQVAAIIAQYQGMLSGFAGSFSGFNYSGSMGTTSLGTYVGGLAKGGQFVATKPTTATFGEGGEPELVTITPLSKLGSLQTKQPLNGVDGLDGQNGQTRIAVQVDLSQDLEARVVEKAMNGTADVVSRINRTKVR